MGQHVRVAFGVLTAIGAAVVIAACGGSGDNASTSGSGGSTEKQTTIGFSQATQNHPFRVAMTKGNQNWAKAHGVKLIVTDAQDKAAKQVADIQSLMSQGIKVIMVSPDQAEPLTPIIKQAMSQGVKILTLDRSVNTPVTEHIGGDNPTIAKEAADYLADKLGGKGNVVEIQGTAGASATIDRHNGFKAEMKAKYPGIKIIATQYADYLRQPAQKYMEDVLQRFGKGRIQGVYAHNDEMGLGAIQALEQAGRLKEVKVISIDGENEGIEAVKDGKLIATFAYPYVAPQGAEQAYKVAKGVAVPAKLVLKTPRIDESNVDQWVGKGF
jgi:ribose transport system substrate-binding protein